MDQNYRKFLSIAPNAEQNVIGRLLMCNEYRLFGMICCLFTVWSINFSFLTLSVTRQDLQMANQMLRGEHFYYI